MPNINRDPVTAETGEQVPARPHDSGSAANRPLMDSTPRPNRYGARRKIHLLVMVRARLRKSRYLTALAPKI
jgi:hypothetical protein